MMPNLINQAAAPVGRNSSDSGMMLPAENGRQVLMSLPPGATASAALGAGMEYYVVNRAFIAWCELVPLWSIGRSIFSRDN
jgi:hypothetical protein